MNLTSPKDVYELLSEIGVRPSKTRGQNFLIDRNILDIILDTADVGDNDTVLEVGPGLGVLTEELVKRARHVTAVELDNRLFEYLADQFGATSNLELIHSDIMDLDLEEMANKTSKVVANLPYSVGSRVLMELVTAPQAPDSIVVTVQREVAERLAAQPGSRNFGMMSVWAQLAYEVSVRKVVNKTCFLPQPEISSAIVAMKLRPAGPVSGLDSQLFREATKHAFMHRRKQLAGIFGAAPGHLKMPADEVRAALEGLGADPRSRPEQLSVDEWCGFVNVLTPDATKA